MLNARLQYRNVAAFAGIVHHDGTATNGVDFADANKPLIAYVDASNNTKSKPMDSSVLSTEKL